MKRILFSLLVFSLIGCGGSSSNGDGDNGAPGVTILFPGTAALTDQPTVTVRGTAADGSGVATLTVNGVAATTTDNFATWTVANLPIAVGMTPIVVDATDGDGNNNPTAAMTTIERLATATTTGSVGTGPAFITLQDLVWDQQRNQLLVVDSANAAAGRVLKVDLATGNRSILSSDAANGGGMPVALDQPVAIAANFIGSAVYVTDVSLDLVVLINIFSGIRVPISDDSVGGAPNFPSPAGIAYNSSNQNVIWVDIVNDHILTAAVGGGIGTRAVISDNADAGAAISMPDRIVHDVSNNRVIFTEALAAGAILSADLTNGNRTTIANAGTGTGGPFLVPSGLVLDLVGNRLVTHLDGSDATVFVNLANGNRTTISSNTGPGVGPDFNIGVAVAQDPVKQLIYVLDRANQAIYVVDQVSGDRVIMSR